MQATKTWCAQGLHLPDEGCKTSQTPPLLTWTASHLLKSLPQQSQEQYLCLPVHSIAFYTTDGWQSCGGEDENIDIHCSGDDAGDVAEPAGVFDDGS